MKSVCYLIFAALLFTIDLHGFQSLELLTAEQLAVYHRDGFLVIEGFVDPKECDKLRARASQLVDQFDPEGITYIFTTKDQSKSRDQYFLDSASTIRFFFEEGAFLEDGSFRFSKERCINKFGHAMHDLDSVFDKFSRTGKLASLIADLGIDHPLLMQSMYIFKQPFIGGEVTCHQDGTFLFTEPDTTIGLWFALEDATLENGCLWVIPEGHLNPLKSRFLKTEKGGTRFEIYDSASWDLTGMIPLEVQKGSLIILHSRVPHMSYGNHSAKSRHAYTLHIIDAKSQYLEDNWLQRPADMPPRGF